MKTIILYTISPLIKKCGLCFVFLVFIKILFAQTYGWSELGIGVNALYASGSIQSVCVDNDGNVYATGSIYDTINYIPASYVARWNGNDWSPLGNLRGQIFAGICADTSGDVFVAGGGFVDFSYVYAIYEWDGFAWAYVDTGRNSFGSTGPISLCVDVRGNVYAGGENYGLGGNGLFVAKWAGAGWIEIGNSLNSNFTINSICNDQTGNLYVAGEFIDSNGYNYVAKWNGSQWSELGTGNSALNVDSAILTICSDAAGNIYAAGSLIDSNGYYYLAKWNGSKWSELGSLQANGAINSICTDKQGNLYAAGNFTHSGYYYVAKWNGSSWAEVGTGFGALNANGTINSVCVNPAGNVYTGGAFTDSAGYNCVAEYTALQPADITSLATTKGTLNIYPNPTTDILYLAFNGNLSTGKIFISDITGKTIYNTACNGQNTQAIDVSNLASGIYFVSLQNESERLVRKFVKE